VSTTTPLGEETPVATSGARDEDNDLVTVTGPDTSDNSLSKISRIFASFVVAAVVIVHALPKVKSEPSADSSSSNVPQVYQRSPPQPSSRITSQVGSIVHLPCASSMVPDHGLQKEEYGTACRVGPVA